MPDPTDKYLEKLDATEKAALTNKGQVNHNPYIWIKKNVLPLRCKYAENKNDTDVQAAIDALPATPDTRIDKSIAAKKVTTQVVKSVPPAKVVTPDKPVEQSKEQETTKK